MGSVKAQMACFRCYSLENSKYFGLKQCGKKPFLPSASEKLSCLPHEFTLSSGPLCPQQLEKDSMLPGLKLPVLNPYYDSHTGALG